MNAVTPILTPKDRARVRRELFERKKTDWVFLVDAITAAKPEVAAIIKNGFTSGQGNVFLLGCQQAFVDYIESELAEDAEQEFLENKQDREATAA